ncbi:mycothiol synthase [Myceligenerans salitolerans]|uniref:Mycothiol acetyltransferase n=1 Tax=Myceligenerans salitolerans TaxID=1230528 RepID=A0ABS3I9D4_9MICO|nr:mycothiol synthase [Myceligenerans salitolerans]MBO0609640.1 mycothiol synthase [Myceligenerans salitolerans]
MSLHIEIGPLSSETRHEVRNIAAAAAGADGVVPLSEQPLLGLSRDEPWLTHVVARDAEDGNGSLGVAGYLQVDRSGPVASAEVVVHPHHRRRGVARRLLRTAELDVTFPMRSGEPGGQQLRVWAHGDLPPARGLAAALGYSPVRELRFLARPINDGPHVPAPDDIAVPEGYALRTFRPGTDDGTWLDLNARAFASHPEQGRLTHEDLRARQAEPWFDPEGFFLLFPAAGAGTEPGPHDSGFGPAPGAAPVAFIWTKIEAGQPTGSRDGEIYVVGVAPEAQGMGLGRLMTDVGLAHLARAGVDRAVLYVEGDNAPALATYKRAGFRQDALHVQYFRA